MAKGLNASTHRKLAQRDNLIDRIIADHAAIRGLTLSDELPPLPTQAELLKRAGARTVKVNA
jgi:hypothetical protein